MPEPVHIRLSELNNRIQAVLENAFDSISYWVIADITNHSFTPQKNYHYFDLVEKNSRSNDIIAKISGKAWGQGSARIQNFEQITGQRFTNNINVLVNVSVNFHPVFGLQVNVNDIDTNFTLGVLEQQRQATLERLTAENPGFIRKTGEQYLTRNNQLGLPVVIQRIAVITSVNSAGGEDFKHTLANNVYGYQFYIDFYYTEVQGEVNARQFLHKIIEVFDSGKSYDVLVITRGGGAQTDFLIFDDYQIGRAVAKFPIPVITGIGHHRNETIADLMAHTQTKTPTQAAEFIISHNKAFEEKVLSFQKLILIKTQQLISGHFQTLALHTSTVVNASRDTISNYKDGLVHINQVTINVSKSILYKNRASLMGISSQLGSKPKMILQNLNRDFQNTIGNLSTFNSQYLKNQRASLAHFVSVINMMSPENILKKGFAIVKVKGRVTSDPGRIKVGEDLDIILSDTRIKTTVRQKTKYDGSDFKL
jgi:exodeoxyribonuclease VII large subunit